MRSTEEDWSHAAVTPPIVGRRRPTRLLLLHIIESAASFREVDCHRGSSLSRLVIVSNRVALPGEGAQRSGGLVTGLLDALHQAGGLWFGWSGKLGKTHSAPTVVEVDGVTYATIDLTRADHDGYYSGLSNSALWPLLHYRLDLVNFTRSDFAAYLRVNRQFADTLAPLLNPNDLIWVHDYHLIPMAKQLRRAGAVQRIGFFLHTPFPSVGVFATLPHYIELLQ